MEQQRLTLCPQGRFELLLLVGPFEDGLAGDRALGRDLFKPCHLALDHVQLLDGAQEFRLLLQQVFVREPQFKQRLARPNGLALDGIDASHDPGQRRRDFDLRPARPLDNHPRHANRSLEWLERDASQLQTKVLTGLLAECQSRGFAVNVIVARRFAVVVAVGVRFFMFMFRLGMVFMRVVAGLAMMLRGMLGGTKPCPLPNLVPPTKSETG